MKFEEVPISRQVAVESGVTELCKALEEIAEDSSQILFHGFEPIEGAPRSGRIFYTDESRGTQFREPLTPEDLAHELFELTRDARYLPCPGRHDLFTEGWEIRKSGMGNNPVAVVWAAWIEFREKEI